MKKVFIFLSLMLVCCFFAHADDSSGWYYDPESPLIGDPAQLSASSIDIPQSGGEDNMFLNLIDGKTSTFFHSYWDRGIFTSPTLTADSYAETIKKLDPTKWRVSGIGYTGLQVKLYDPVKVFFFTFTGRNTAPYCDTPNDIIVYATNDDALGSSTVPAESAKWTKVTELTEGFPGPVALGKYASPAIEMDQAYKYIRFEVRNTVTSSDGGTDLRPTARVEVTGRVWNLSEFQMYEGKKVEGYRSRLDSLVNAVQAGSYDFEGSDDPGYYPKALVDSFYSAKQYALDNYILVDLSDDQCKAIYEKLYSALNAVQQSQRNPLEDGYYNIVSAWQIFRQKQGVDKAWYYESAEDALKWMTYDRDNTLQLFKLEKQADGSFSVQNVESGKYLGHLDRNGLPVPFTENFESKQIFTPFDAKPYEFKVYSPDFNSTYNKYNTRQHNNGSGVIGQVSAWDSDMDGEAAWTLRRVQGALLDSLLKASKTEKLRKDIHTALYDAMSTYDKCYTYKQLFTDASQMTVNSQNPSDGSIAALLDGNTGTYFHSDWQQAFKQPMTEGTGWHNMQFTLPEAVGKIKFSYYGRNNASGYVDDPDHITLYGTNDDALGASTAAADSAKWTEIVDMKAPQYDFPTVKVLSGSGYISPAIDLGANYKYLRFVVKHTNGENTLPSRTFYDPSVSGVTFELSEFRLMDANPTDDSEADHVSGMKEACEALLQQMDETRAKYIAGQATESDVEALKEATAKVNALYVDRDAIDRSLKDALKKAKAVYDEQTGSKVSILNRADQMSTNNVDISVSGASSQSEALGHLIDGNINTIFHSNWNRSIYSSPTLTEESYAEYIKTLNSAINYVNGIGYHNLQVKLDAPRDKFYFTYTGRNDAVFHDTPNDVAVYATNDDALGSSTLDSETSEWQKVTELTENMPENVQAAEYESPLIDMGDTYKYIRFVVKGITRIENRPTTLPEVTGIVYNLSEFHMYAGEDPETLPYTHNADLKAAVDALKPLIDKYSAAEAHSIYTTAPIDSLNAAIAKVNSFTVDTTEMVALYNDYAERIGNSVVGSEIGYVDTQSSIEAFATALTTARQSVTVPTKIAVDKAVKAMKDAYATFLTHVAQIKGNTWYNILSASSREIFTGQPLRLSPAKYGNDIKVGDFDLDNAEPSTDPYAIWRFVPVKDAEGSYYIQNLGSGQYMGRFNDQNTTMQTEHTPTAYRLIYFGDGGFRITQAANPDDKLALKTDKTRKAVLTYPLNSDNQQVFNFSEVLEGQDIYLSDYKDNSIQIVTLPYATKGESSITALNDGKAETYAVKYLTTADGGTKLGLKKISETEAGVPFILVLGDYTQKPSADSVSLHLTVPALVSDSAVNTGALIGTLTGMSVTKEGLGMFVSNGLYSTTSLTTPFAARSGYIDPSRVVNEEGEADLVISSSDIINAVKQITATPAGTSGKVKVYTVEGTFLKESADEAEALKGLSRGIYIIGKKKVIVR